ncbi:MAG: BrnA antitoxin family protein [Pseudomonadota bacterium]
MAAKRTKAEERAHSELLIELAEMDLWMHQFRLKEGFIPEGWEDMEERAPVTEPKTKVTISIDTKVLRWFKGLGRGYQARVNAVLRTYMLSILSKEVQSRADRDWKGEPL